MSSSKTILPDPAPVMDARSLPGVIKYRLRGS